MNFIFKNHKVLVAILTLTLLPLLSQCSSASGSGTDTEITDEAMPSVDGDVQTPSDGNVEGDISGDNDDGSVSQTEDESGGAGDAAGGDDSGGDGDAIDPADVTDDGDSSGDVADGDAVDDVGDQNLSEDNTPDPAVVITPIQVSAGSNYTCALLSDGQVYCWGRNVYGELGDISLPDSATPIAVTLPTTEAIVEISAGYNHACAVDATGGVYCWGRNLYGQLGAGNVDETVHGPVTVSAFGAALPVAHVSANNASTCALLRDGNIQCWGNNLSGEMGNGTTSETLTPVTVSGFDPLNPAVQISSGSSFHCARYNDGAVKCWGSNVSGQLGIGTTDFNKTTPEQVVGIDAASPAIDIASGGMASHVCAVLFDGAVKCWGRNDEGELGDNTQTDSTLPVQVAGLDATQPAVDVSVDGFNSCAILSDGTMRCWGANLYGQTGNGLTDYYANYYYAFSPLLVSGTETYEQVDVGGGQSCALTLDHELRCWGTNFFGQVGNGTATSSPLPTEIPNLLADTAEPRLGLGKEHSCLVTANQELVCWGNDQGPIDPLTGMFGDTSTPVTIGINGADVEMIAAGQFHTCVLQHDDVIRCWGQNTYGQLGDGTYDYAYPEAPVTVTGANGANRFNSISAGAGFTCALRANGTVYCWGSNTAGQLGDGTIVDSTVPVKVLNITNTNPAVSLSAGYDHACAVLADGSAYCWGSNSSGKLANTGLGSSTPLAVPGLDATHPAVLVTTGQDFTCFLKGDGTVACAGSTRALQLGDYNTITLSSTLQDQGHFSAADPALSLNASSTSQHTCALMGSGGIQCWGLDTYGQLGEGQFRQNFSAWTPVFGITSAVAVKVGQSHSCAILTDGHVNCWGYSGYGQAGSGLPMNVDTFAPVEVQITN